MTEVTTQLDFYKTFHHKAYHPQVTGVYSNFTARHGGHSNIKNGEGSYVAGLQAFVKKVLDEQWGEFFDSPTEDEAVGTYERVVAHGLGRPENAQHLRDLWNLGYLPLEIRALEEGMKVPYGIPHFTIESTAEGFGWLTNMIETVCSAEVWPVHTSLTTGAEYYKVFSEYADKTGFPQEFVKFQGHDFSFRGMMGVEAAKLSGMGHLMSGFVGSDTIPAATSLEKYYKADLSPENPCTVIASVDATEHSVQCSFDNDDGAYIDYCMDVASPEGILSIVSDGYDFWKLVAEIIPARKEKIMQRNGLLVIRPDSGDPVDILCGTYKKPIPEFLREEMSDNWKDEISDFFVNDIDDEYSEECGQGFSCDGTATRLFRLDGQLMEATFDIIVVSSKQDRGDRLYWIDRIKLTDVQHTELSPEDKGLVEYLYEVFGGTETEKGFKLLDSHIGCIYGDSITLDRQKEILERLYDKGFCSGNVVLGIGSYTYQYVTRDTHDSAVKATSIIKGDERVAIAKDPKTGDGSKKSAKGLLCVTKTGGDYKLISDVTEEIHESEENLLQPIWKNGEWLREQSLEEIRENVLTTF